MEARARIVVDTVGGRLRLVELRSQPPLTLRRTGAAEISIVGSAAAPLGGDRLALEVVVGAGTSVAIRSVAATLAYPGVHGGDSCFDVNVSVGEGASLDWSPEPTVAVDGCRHSASSTVVLVDESSRLRWCDVMVRGRWRERSGAMRQRLAIDRAGAPLLRNEVALDPAQPSDAASLGGYRIVAGAVIVGEPSSVADAGSGAGTAWASHPLAADATAWTVLSSDLAAVRAALGDHAAHTHNQYG